MLTPGQDVWRQTYSSPVMAVYVVEHGSLRKVPSTSVAADTLSSLTSSSLLAVVEDSANVNKAGSMLQ